MRLNNTFSAEDDILSLAEEAGGIAGKAVEVCERLDIELTKARKKIEELESLEEINQATK